MRDTDFCDLQGDTLLGLADVLRSAGSVNEASQLVEEARRIFEAKGNVVRTTEAAGLGSAV